MINFWKLKEQPKTKLRLRNVTKQKVAIEKTCWDKTWKGTNQFLILIWVMSGLNITTYCKNQNDSWNWHLMTHLWSSWNFINNEMIISPIGWMNSINYFIKTWLTFLPLAPLWKQLFLCWGIILKIPITLHMAPRTLIFS